MLSNIDVINPVFRLASIHMNYLDIDWKDQWKWIHNFKTPQRNYQSQMVSMTNSPHFKIRVKTNSI